MPEAPQARETSSPQVVGAPWLDTYPFVGLAQVPPEVPPSAPRVGNPLVSDGPARFDAKERSNADRRGTAQGDGCTCDPEGVGGRAHGARRESAGTLQGLLPDGDRGSAAEGSRAAGRRDRKAEARGRSSTARKAAAAGGGDSGHPVNPEWRVIATEVVQRVPGVTVTEVLREMAKVARGFTPNNWTGYMVWRMRNRVNRAS